MTGVIDYSEDLVLLHGFNDALDAGRACEHLRKAGIPFLLEDLSEPRQGIHQFAEGPSIRMNLLVRYEDLKRARVCLRNTMHLFPEREVGVVMHGGDGDEVQAQAAVCETQDDAESVRGALTAANIWSRTERIVDKEDASYVTYSVEVKGKDIEEAMRVLERWCK